MTDCACACYLFSLRLCHLQLVLHTTKFQFDIRIVSPWQKLLFWNQQQRKVHHPCGKETNNISTLTTYLYIHLPICARTRVNGNIRPYFVMYFCNLAVLTMLISFQVSAECTTGMVLGAVCQSGSNDCKILKPRAFPTLGLYNTR